uniref:Reverse transcriptase domain-containing protein n=1 Tax=Tanacetum cinerariifolium TaxID=118510 RepID=A0A6L2L890_TANCI|nr:reverse transcriptase domain-containing protein [Tanacetum cinerariifolium]
MRTRSSFNLPIESPPNPSTSNPKRRNRRRSKQPFILEESPVDTMADQPNMAKLLRASTEGYAEAIAVLPILAEAARRWLKKEPPRSILTWEDLVSKFINPEEDECVEETLTDQDLAKDPIHPNIPYPSRMLNQKQQEKDDVQIYKFWQMFKQLHINITLADALILIPKYQKMLKALLSNKEKLLELANTPLNENCSAIIHKKLHEKLGDPGKFLIPCGFSELKCKALADLGASINLMPLSVWKKLGLPELISTRMTLELANRAICTPVEIARDVFVPVGKFTFPTDFVIVDYESYPRVPFILGRPFLLTARALIDVHKEEMILRDGHKRLTLKYLLHHDPIKDMDSSLKDSIDQNNLVDLNDNLVDTVPEMFTDEHTLNYSSPPLYDEYDDDLFKVKSDTEYVYDDPFDSKGEKIKESKLLIDELDLPSDFLPSSEYDSFLSKDFSKVDALPSTNNEYKVFNLGILIQENLFEVITHVAPDKNAKKLAISTYPHSRKPFQRSSQNYLIEAIKFSKSTKFLKARWRFLFSLVERTSTCWMFLVSTSTLFDQLKYEGNWVNESGAAKSFPGSFSQRGCAGFSIYKQIDI